MLKNRIRAFTLVELLVVIGIIALLVSMLLPALNKSRQQAVSIKCMSNLKQVGNAFMMYANDNHGWLPPGDTGCWHGSDGYGVEPQIFVYWHKTPLSAYRGAPQAVNDEANCTVVLALAKYLGVNNPHFVPAAQGPIAVPEFYCPAHDQTVDNLTINANFFLTDNGGGEKQSDMKYRYWGNPFGCDKDLLSLQTYGASDSIIAQGNSGNWMPLADYGASLAFLGEDQVQQNNDPDSPPPASDGTAHDGLEYARKVGTKNAASIVIMTDDTKHANKFVASTGGNLLSGKGYCMHGSAQNGWANELYGDLHVESVKYGSWRLHVEGGTYAAFWY